MARGRARGKNGEQGKEEKTNAPDTTPHALARTPTQPSYTAPAALEVGLVQPHNARLRAARGEPGAVARAGASGVVDERLAACPALLWSLFLLCSCS